MRVELFYDYERPLEQREDGFFYVPYSSLFAVFDGCSEPWWPGHPPFKYFGKITGGQMIIRVCLQVFASSFPEEPLQEVVLRANERVWEVQAEHRGSAVSLGDASTLANASFSCVNVLDEEAGEVEGVWGADVFTILRKSSGEVTIFGGDNFESDLRREQVYRDLVAAKGEAGKTEYFQETYPQLKREDENIRFAVLNGSPDIERCWNTFHMSGVEFIILISDGAWAPLERWKENPAIAKEFVRRFEEDGLEQAIGWINELQQKGIADARVKKPEATVLAVSFD